MDKATAVEVAHQIQELIKTRDAIDSLEGCKQAIIPDNTVIQVMTLGNVVRTVSIPPHVMRFIVEQGYLLDACQVLEKAHSDQLKDLTGIVVGRD